MNIEDLIGCTISSIDGAFTGSDEILFVLNDGKTFRMFHSQSCCENVEVEDITGDINDLIEVPLVMAEEIEQLNDNSGTWTFYKFATANGYVTIRWLGTSNGYYSESVTCEWGEKQSNE